MDADTTMKKSANFIFHFDDQKSSVQTVKEKEESVKVKEESWSSIYEYHPSSCSSESERQNLMVEIRDSIFHKLEIYGDFKNESINMESQIQQTDDKKPSVVENTFCFSLKDIDTKFSQHDLESTKSSFDDLKLLKQEYHRDENDLQQSKEAVDPACISSLKAKVEADVLNVYSREDEDTGSIKVTSPFIQRQIEPNYLKGESLIDQKPQAEGQLYPTDSMNGVSVLKKYSHLPKRSNECKKNKGNLRLDSRIDKENGPSDFGCVSRCTSKVNQEINCRSMIKTPSVRIIVKPHNKPNTQTHFGVLDQQENSNQSLCKKLFRTECSSQFNFYTEKLTNRPNYTGRTTDQSAVKPNQCGSRGKCFTRKSNLITQKNMHLVKPLTFDACKREFSRKVNLKEHENARITIKPFTCDVCEKGFTKRSSSRDHKKIHLAVKPYTCDVCQKGFTKKFNLKDHKKVHLAVHVKPYTCDVCQKSFARLVGLNNHKNMHLTVKPYKCEVCKKGFITRTNLKVHKNTHLAEKLYT